MEKKFEYICTEEMETMKEVEEWENKNKGKVIYSDGGGIIELQKTCLYSIDDEGKKEEGTEKNALGISVLDNCSEDEIMLLFSSREEVRNLRDYLNNYLENNFNK